MHIATCLRGSHFFRSRLGRCRSGSRRCARSGGQRRGHEARCGGWRGGSPRRRPPHARGGRGALAAIPPWRSTGRPTAAPARAADALHHHCGLERLRLMGVALGVVVHLRALAALLVEDVAILLHRCPKGRVPVRGMDSAQVVELRVALPAVRIPPHARLSHGLVVVQRPNGVTAMHHTTCGAHVDIDAMEDGVVPKMLLGAQRLHLPALAARRAAQASVRTRRPRAAMPASAWWRLRPRRESRGGPTASGCRCSCRWDARPRSGPGPGLEPGSCGWRWRRHNRRWLSCRRSWC